MPADPKKLEMIEVYNEALALYKKREFEKAKELFQKALEIYPGDGASELYIGRCDDFIKSPPPDDWDGVYVFTTK